jgi:hypothetical protein
MGTVWLEKLNEFIEPRPAELKQRPYPQRGGRQTRLRPRSVIPGPPSIIMPVGDTVSVS